MTPIHAGLTAAAALALPLAASCGGAGLGAGEVTVTDSAGVTIVANHAEPASLAAWSLDAEPVMDIGVVEGEAAYQLFRVMDAALLDDGRLVVLNAGTQQLRLFEESGRFLKAVGRDGEGPGEYRFPFRVMVLPDDSLLVYDIGLARFTVLDSSLAVGRTFRPDRGLLNEPRLAGLIGDSVIVSHETIYSIPASGFDTMYSRVAFFDLDGHGRDSLMVPDRRMGRLPAESGRGLVGSPHFEPSAVFTTGESGVWVGGARTAELRLYGRDGSLRRIVRWPWSPRNVGEAEVAALVERRVSRASPGSRAMTRTMYEGTPAADAFPAYVELHGDTEGRLWVRQFTPPGHEGPAAWLVLDPSGRLIARATLPADARILEIGNDYVLAAVTDDLEVEHVRMWSLRRGAPEN